MSNPLTSVSDEYVRSINASDPAAFIGLFAENAVVDDAGREFRGLDAIKTWSDQEIFAARVTLEVLDQARHPGEAEITTKVDGNFDKTGLPDPVIITHQFSVENEKIVGLTCRLAC